MASIPRASSTGDVLEELTAQSPSSQEMPESAKQPPIYDPAFLACISRMRYINYSADGARKQQGPYALREGQSGTRMFIDTAHAGGLEPEAANSRNIEGQAAERSNRSADSKKRSCRRSSSFPRPQPKQARRRPAIHRLLHSLFGAPTLAVYNDSASDSTGAVSTVSPEIFMLESFEDTGAYCDIPQAPHLGGIQCRTSSSIDLVSPRAFLFSSPRLQGDGTSSLSRSISFIPSQLSLLNASFSAETDVSPHLMNHGTRTSLTSAIDSDVLERFLLEPIEGPGSSRSMSQVLLSRPSIDALETAEHNLASTGRPSSLGQNGNVSMRNMDHVRSLPLNVVACLAKALERESFFALKGTCRLWYTALRTHRSQKQSLAPSLPVEVLQHMFWLLSPCNFHNARHTCRDWMAASLDRHLLLAMLQRGGLLSALHRPCDAVVTSECALQILQKYDIWTQSCLISRECALSASYTGNGLNGPSNDGSSSKAFVEIGRVDFQDLASGFAGEGVRQSSGLVFEVSVCGYYLTVAEGGMIYVYALEGNSLRPLTSLVCPRRVLAMSIDASSRRFAIAALLDGRMGLVCDLRVGKDPNGQICRLSKDDANDYEPGPSTQGKYSVFSSEVPSMGANASFAQQIKSRGVQTFETDAAADAVDNEHGWVTAFNAIDVQSNGGHNELDRTDEPAYHDRNWINQEWNFHLRSKWMRTISRKSLKGKRQKSSAMPDFDNEDCIPVETGNRNVYRHLCSDDDPPRSVAICPQRRCVAFGCSAGIELHWVDALTGQDLNRWFPLTAPSDFLYFLSPRAGLDTAKKLRLISSAAHPSQRPALCRKFNAGRTWLNTFFGFGSDDDQEPRAAVSISDCDHYRAVPLSDGYHVLFTDPITGLMCLGTDAPLGGPIKLLRKIMFVPPTENRIQTSPQQQNCTTGPLPPRLYAAAHELRLGPRLVCVYGDDVVLYTVPPDTFAYSRDEPHAEKKSPDDNDGQASSIGERPKERLPWLDWWPYDTLDNAPPATSESDLEPDTIWPLYVRGSHVGHLPGLVEIAINETTGGDVNIWALSFDGRAVIWQLDLGQKQHGVIRKTVIGHDARVESTYFEDVDGDAIMSDAGVLKNDVATATQSLPSSVEASKRPIAQFFDGNDSYLGSPAWQLPQDMFPCNAQVVPRALHIDRDDQLMSLPAPSPGWSCYDADGPLYLSDSISDPQAAFSDGDVANLDIDSSADVGFLDVISS